MENSPLLSPWDQIPYFQPIVETFYPNMGSAISVAKANPQRIGLIFSANGSQSIRVSTRSDLASDRGILLAQAALPLTLTHGDYGALVQCEWFAVPTLAGGTLTVIEVLLAKWPRMGA